MRKIVSAAAAFALALTAPSPAFAWGTAAHRFIMGRAIDILPSDIKPFFEHHRVELMIRVVDPETWRQVGWEEDANHFVDFGVADYGAYPFTMLPRDFTAAVEKFGMAVVRKNGLLPWREAEMFGNLRREMEGFKRELGYAVPNTVLFAAVASHYIQDATQPFHASNNFNGQFTKQFGIHARFEAELFERFQARLTMSPPPIKPMMNPRDAAFDQLLASYLLVQPVLDADREAIAGKDTYDDEYYEKFFVKVKPVLEKRLSEAITATASVIVGAWEQAGKPTLKPTLPWPVEKVRR
jgi:hypothetical protein